MGQNRIPVKLFKSNGSKCKQLFNEKLTLAVLADAS